MITMHLKTVILFLDTYSYSIRMILNFDKLLRMISDNIRTQRFDVSMTSFSSDKKFNLSGLIYTVRGVIWNLHFSVSMSK